MDWYNEPPQWAVEDDMIRVQTGPQTDFWRRTHYDFIRDNGHFFAQAVVGDFVAEVEVRGGYTALYDQAGLMLRADETHWLKCGIELLDGRQHASAVVTREYSDWSVAPLPQNPEALWLRLRRQGSTVEIHYALDGRDYQLLRLAYLPTAEGMRIGLMCASPEGRGFPVIFKGFRVRRS